MTRDNLQNAYAGSEIQWNVHDIIHVNSKYEQILYAQDWIDSSQSVQNLFQNF